MVALKAILKQFNKNGTGNIVAGISIYKIPYKLVNSYIKNYENNEMLYSENIFRFLAYNKENNLPEPTIKLKTISRSMSEAEILANFENFHLWS